jgi:hypothetical protein
MLGLISVAREETHKYGNEWQHADRERAAAAREGTSVRG